MRISHPDRVLFPEDGITKRDLVEYYLAVAPALLPHLRDRPANLQRFPSGIGRSGFFQQAIGAQAPEWMLSATVPKRGGTVRHPVLQHAAALAYVVNLGCITPHVWLSRVGRLDRPDQLIFDLDPSEGSEASLADAARLVRDALAERGLTAFLKATGSRGYHVVVPLRGDDTFDTARGFAQQVAALLAERHPDLFTTEARKDARGARIYLDTLRNAYAHTAVPPYAVRARAGAPVAAPLAWQDLDAPDMHPARYTIRDMPDRVRRGVDPWRGWRRMARGLE